MRFIKQPLIFFLCLSYLEMKFLSLQENGYFPNVSECWHLSFKRYTDIALRGSGVFSMTLCRNVSNNTMLTSYTFTFIEWNKDFLYPQQKSITQIKLYVFQFWQWQLLSFKFCISQNGNKTFQSYWDIHVYIKPCIQFQMKFSYLFHGTFPCLCSI